MLNFFRSDPIKKLNKEYLAIMEKAMNAQRAGDIRLYSELSEQANVKLEAIEQLEKRKED